MSTSSENELPKYFENLTKNDQLEYLKLRSLFSSKECRNNRGQRLNKFSEILKTIQNFCVKNDAYDPIRFLVCGICWIPNGIAINTRQLRLLIDKCKSSINGSLQRIGFSAVTMKDSSYQQLYEKIPQLKDKFKETREWSIRQTVFSTPQPKLNFNINVNNLINNNKAISEAHFQTPAPSFYETKSQSMTLNDFDNIDNIDYNENNNYISDGEDKEFHDDWDQFCLPPSYLFEE